MGNWIEISGTVAFEGEDVVGEGDAYKQTQCILSRIERVLTEAGASLRDVIRTRIYVTDISRWEEVGRAHGEVFKEIKPATSMVEVSALIDPRFLIEIEATAIVNDP